MALTNDLSATIETVQGPALTKGTQGTTGFMVQNISEAGRNVTNYFMALPVLATATDALVSFTGFKSNAAVAATTTPAVVSVGKSFRISSITITYIAIATAASVKVTLRSQAGGVVTLTSPAVGVWVVGAPAAVAGVTQTVQITIPDGMEFAAGSGVGATIQGLSATQVAAAAGYAQIVIQGYEY